MDVNRATIVGRLTRDPESRTTPNGTTVTSFGVATNFVYKNKDGQKTETVEYHNIVTWRKLAEIAAQYLKKGRRVLVEGRLQTRTWEANDGTKRQRTEIIADNIIMLDSSKSPLEPEVASASPAEPPAPTEEPPLENTQNKKSNDEISVEDIPF